MIHSSLIRASLIRASLIHVCALRDLERLSASLHDYRLLTLMSPLHSDKIWKRYARAAHLDLAFNDIVEARDGMIAPDRDMIAKIIDFGNSGDSDLPLLIHCWAGISRSSAGAYIIACAHNPGHEMALADELRRRAPFATPNVLMVSLADELLSRNGRMIAAIHAIGRGEDAFGGTPYEMPLLWPAG